MTRVWVAQWSLHNVAPRADQLCLNTGALVVGADAMSTRANLRRHQQKTSGIQDPVRGVSCRVEPCCTSSLNPPSLKTLIFRKQDDVGTSPNCPVSRLFNFPNRHGAADFIASQQQWLACWALRGGHKFQALGRYIPFGQVGGVL